MPDERPGPGGELAALRAVNARLRRVVEAKNTKIAALRAALELGRARTVHRTVSAEVAFQRSLRRGQAVPTRRAHADPGPSDAAEHAANHSAFERLSIDARSSTPPTAIGLGSGSAWHL